MKIQTFSIVAGTEACDADCPFCVSKMTGFDILPPTKTINTINFAKAVQFAVRGDCSTCLITGKGEPMLYPDQIEMYLQLLNQMKNPFPFIEIQTNGLKFMRNIANKDERKFFNMANQLTRWRSLGLNTIAVSAVDTIAENNAKIYHPSYKDFDLGRMLCWLNDLGFTTRLCIIMLNGIVSTPKDIERIIQFCKNHKVAQLTVRPTRKSKNGIDKKAVEFVDKHTLSEKDEIEIKKYVEENGTLLMNLMQGNHKAGVYDLNGQNICVSDCLTIEPNYDEIRTLIFYADGRLYYDWSYEGARIL